MDKEIVIKLHSSFEDMVRKYPDTGTEFWCARDLQMLLGYVQWRSFAAVIDKAITACQKAGYRKWARRYLDNEDYQTVKAADIRRNPHKYVLVLNFMDLQELTDLKPKAGSPYIHSSSTPWSKPLEIEDSILRNWLGLFGIAYHQIHASGHAAEPYLQEMIESMQPGCVIPIHTEKPALFKVFGTKTIIPEEGKAIKF